MNSPHGIYNDPLLVQKRKGTIDDPFTKIIEPAMIVKGKVQLREIPNRFDRVRVSGEGINWKEITNNNAKEIRQNGFIVNYLEGIVTFNSMHDGKTLTFTYTGEGVHYFPDSRIYLTKDQNFVSMADKLEDVDRLIEEQKSRVDEQILSVPQPSEVVDQRIDRNGVVHRTAKDRMDNEQKKIEDAYKDMHNQRFSSLKSRIDAEQKKIEDAHVDLNSNVFFTLKERIDAEQRKIEEAYKDLNNRAFPSLKQRIDSEQRKIEESLDDGKGTVYPSLKARIKNFDDRISDFEQNIESVEDRLLLKVGRDELTGENLVALIEMTPEGVLISGRKINLNGIISINDLDSEAYQKVFNAIAAADINLTGSLPNSVRMDQNGITAYTSDPNKYARFNADGIYAKNGAITIERADGYKVVENGTATWDFAVYPHEPPYKAADVNMYEMAENKLNTYYAYNTSTFEYLDVNFYSYRHTGRYLCMDINLGSAASGQAQFAVIDRDGRTKMYELVSNSGLADFDVIRKVKVDLGVPTGQLRSFYIRIAAGIHGVKTFLKINRIWQEG